HPRTATMVRTGASVEWTVVATEAEALQLEYSWSKEYDPRFNVKYRDDKSYPFLAVTMGDEFPRAQVMRGAKRKGTRYFGPYAGAGPRAPWGSSATRGRSARPSTCCCASSPSAPARRACSSAPRRAVGRAC